MYSSLRVRRFRVQIISKLPDFSILIIVIGNQYSRNLFFNNKYIHWSENKKHCHASMIERWTARWCSWAGFRIAVTGYRDGKPQGYNEGDQNSFRHSAHHFWEEVNLKKQRCEVKNRGARWISELDFLIFQDRRDLLFVKTSTTR